MVNEINLESNEFRYERKYFIPYELKNFLPQLFLNHPLRLREVFYKRLINNIYFDSLEFSSFNENIQGFSNRNKIRVRWYGNIFGFISPILEIKSRRGNVGKKKSFKLNKFNFKKDTKISDFKEFLISQEIPLFFKDLIYSYQPQLLNSYERIYYQSFNNKYRFTLDSDIKNFKYQFHCENFVEVKPRFEHLILEIKYKDCDDLFVDSIANFFPFRLTRYSKYCTGILAIS